MSINLSKITLQRLFLFQEVSRLGSLSKAAKFLEMPISTLSREIVILEESLQKSLKSKDRKILTLTDDGKKLSKFASVVLNEIKNLEQEHSDLTEQTITIASTYGICEIYLPSILNEFCQKFPNVSIKLRAGDPYIQFTDNNIDLVIGQNLLQRPDLSQRKLMTFTYYIFSSKNYLEKVKGKISLNKLEDIDLILYDKEKAKYEGSFEKCSCLIESNSYRSILELGNLDMGAFPFSSHAINFIDPKGSKYVKVLDTPCEEEDIYFIHSKHSPKVTMINAFIDISNKQMKGIQND